MKKAEHCWLIFYYVIWIYLLKEYKSRGKAGSERTERKDKEPAPKTKTLKPDDDSPARKSKPQKSKYLELLSFFIHVGV